MTVKELIDELKKYPEGMEIAVWDADYQDFIPAYGEIDVNRLLFFDKDGNKTDKDYVTIV